MTHIVTDTVADIPADLAKQLDITLVPCYVNFGTESLLDRVELTPNEFYRRLAASKDLPKTAAAAPGVFGKEYERLVSQGDDVVSIHVGAKLSGIYNAARLGVADYGERVALVDSTNVSMGLGWLAVHAARAAQSGATQTEVVALCERLVPRLRVWAVLDTLEYLQRGGRISQAQFLVGSLLRIKPMIQVKDSAVESLENVRTLRKAVERLVEVVQAAGPAESVCVLHATAPDLAAEVVRRLSDYHPVDKIVVSEAGPGIGTHTGPGAVGVAALLAG